jgi:hypothetical protein
MKWSVSTLAVILLSAAPIMAQLPDKQRLLEQFTFWDNRDWDWYKANIPFLETPDQEVDVTYYYRWEVVTKHLTYGSPRSGYSYTEFIDRPFWSGTYGAISCPAGHQLYEVRWLRDPNYAQDYARYWFHTPGAQPRNYSTWLADSVWAVHSVQNDEAFATELLPALVENYRGWEQRHFVPATGLFWQTGHDDGMEFNINSRQTEDILRGAPSYRPSFNAYMYADALAIAKIARLAQQEQIAGEFQLKADRIKQLVQQRLWDSTREFFFPMFRQDERREGHVVKANTLTYQSGKFAGSPHGRELIGYVPWQFNLPDAGYEKAWQFLMDPAYFAAPFGPTVTERNDPQFLVTNHCCWWSGQSWPYATTQTLVALANLLNHYDQDVVNKQDYFQLLRTYALTHRKNGQPYIAEGANPDTGSWEGYDNYNHSEHYFHSGFCDLVISGLIGLRPRHDDTIHVNPLVPHSWDYFALMDVPYHGRLVSVLWDRTGDRYQRGKGLRILVDGQTIAERDTLGELTAMMPDGAERTTRDSGRNYNFAVNNDGSFYPAMTASSMAPGQTPQVLQDGNYWYHVSPPNRWTTAGSTADVHWIEVDLGVARPIHEIVLYLLDDTDRPDAQPSVRLPRRIELQVRKGGSWQPIEVHRQSPETLRGRSANRFHFQGREAQQIRVLLTAHDGHSCGLSELEVWGQPGPHDLNPPGRPSSLATHVPGRDHPQVRASHTSRFDTIDHANDGIISYRPSPHNRWTTYESPDASDWLEVDFGQPTLLQRVELHFYDDRGGVQPPADYSIEVWMDDRWVAVERVEKSPLKPTGGTMNTATFQGLTASKLRVVFQHAGAARSGVTEIEVW